MLVGKQNAQRTVPSIRISLPGAPLSLQLAWREIWRNKGRFLLVSLVIALITTLVLFIAGLAEGLGAGNKEYIENLNADLLVYQENVDLSITSSRIDRSVVKKINRLDGVAAVGAIGFSNASIVLPNGQEPLKISLIGVEPGQPGEPPALEGQGLRSKRHKEAVIGRNVAVQTGLQVGDTFSIKSIQDTQEEFYELTVAGISDGQQYSIQPSIFVPYLTWDRIRPQGKAVDDNPNIVFNVAAVALENPAAIDAVAPQIEAVVGKVQTADLKTAYEATPGYSAQQSTLNTQRGFTLLIGLLVVGGFFQIQALQKVAQVGMLKAIGASNLTVAIAFLSQIVLITALGVAIGGLGTLALSLAFPPAVPIVFDQNTVLISLASLMIIGPLGGLISLRILLKVEPLTALGLAS